MLSPNRAVDRLSLTQKTLLTNRAVDRLSLTQKKKHVNKSCSQRFAIHPEQPVNRVPGFLEISVCCDKKQETRGVSQGLVSWLGFLSMVFDCTPRSPEATPTPRSAHAARTPQQSVSRQSLWEFAIWPKVCDQTEGS